MSSLKDLYEKDFVLWVEENLKLLKNKQFDLVDWEHLLEEIEDLAGRYVDDVIVLMAKILASLYKYENFREEDKINAWIKIILNSRTKLERLFDRMPSLKDKAVNEIETAWRFAVIDMVFYFEYPGSEKLVEKYFGGKKPAERDFPEKCPYTFQQILEYEPWIDKEML
jgi:Domain of unknown function DUF29.